MTRSGTPVSRLAVRDEIDKLTNHVALEASFLAQSFQAGKLNIGQFEKQTSELLKAGHITAASIGKGGIGRMTQKDWETVGAKIAWQNDYLSKFAKKVGAGTLSPKMTAYRATLYADSLFTSFSTTYFNEGKASVPEGDHPERCKLVTNSLEGCKECAADAAQGWVNIKDMKPIGTRICGDFCKCDIIFENDDDPIPEFDIKVDVTNDAQPGGKPPAPPVPAGPYSTTQFINPSGLSQDQLVHFAKLSGIPDDYPHRVLIDELAYSGGKFEVSTYAVDSKLSLRRTIDPVNKVIENDFFQIKDKQAYSGTKIFAQQVKNASEAGYKKIETTAVGGDSFNGAYTWLRLGYKPRKFSNAMEQLVDKYNKQHGTQLLDIRDFMATKQGQAFWKANQTSFNGEFDLKADSRSMATLSAYVKERKIDVALPAAKPKPVPKPAKPKAPAKAEPYSKATFNELSNAGALTGLTRAEMIEYARLSGVPEDFPGEIKIRRPPSGDNVSIVLNDDGIKMHRLVYVKTKEIVNTEFVITDKTKHNGTKIFASQVDHASKAGFTSISTVAARDIHGGPANGYYTWLRLGYNPKQITDYMSGLLAEFNKLNGTSLKDVREFMATKKGQDFWKKKGSVFQGVFDLKAGSNSRKTLDAYLKARGFKK